MGKDMMWRKKWSTTDVLPGQRRSVPAVSRQRGTQAREQRGFVCIQWNCFCTQSGFQLLWGRRKALLATLKCLVLPAFGSMRGARTKYTTVQCKLSDKKLIQHRASWTPWKQGVDGLPWRCTLSFLLEERELLTLLVMNLGSSKEGEGTASVKRAASTTRNSFFRADEDEWWAAPSREPLPSAGHRSPPLVAVLQAGWRCEQLQPAATAHPPLLPSPPGAASAGLSGWRGNSRAKRQSHLQKVWEAHY